MKFENLQITSKRKEDLYYVYTINNNIEKKPTKNIVNYYVCTEEKYKLLDNVEVEIEENKDGLYVLESVNIRKTEEGKILYDYILTTRKGVVSDSNFGTFSLSETEIVLDEDNYYNIKINKK